MTKTNADACPRNWEETLARFEAHLAEQERSPETVRAYTGDLQLFEAWYREQNKGDAPELATINEVDLRGWKASLLALHQQPQSVNRRMAAIRALMKWGESHDWCPAVQRPKSVKQTARPPRWLTKNENNALVREVNRCRGPERLRDVALIVFLLNSGLRVAEARILDLELVELSERKGTVTVIGKGSSQRTVDLNAEVRKALMALAYGHEDWKQRNPKMPNRLDTEQPVWQGREGRLTANALWRIIARYGRLAQIHGLSPHMLRHTFAHDLAVKGVPIQLISGILGHKSVNTTMIYIQAGQEEMRAAVELLVAGDEDDATPENPASRPRRPRGRVR